MVWPFILETYHPGQTPNILCWSFAVNPSFTVDIQRVRSYDRAVSSSWPLWISGNYGTKLSWGHARYYSLSIVMEPYKYPGYPMLITTIQVLCPLYLAIPKFTKYISSDAAKTIVFFVDSERPRTRICSQALLVFLKRHVNYVTTPSSARRSMLKSCVVTVVWR